MIQKLRRLGQSGPLRRPHSLVAGCSLGAIQADRGGTSGGSIGGPGVQRRPPSFVGLDSSANPRRSEWSLDDRIMAPGEIERE